MCINNKPNCSFNQTKYTMHMSEPFPEVLLLNINWDGQDVGQMDILKFVISIPSRINLTEMFEVSHDHQYILKGLVCFLGAHYLTYMKQIVDGVPLWRLYNDEEILTYPRWGDILSKILEFGK